MMSLYEVLGVYRSITTEELLSLYNRKSFLYKGLSVKEIDESNKAFKILLDEEKRKEYDKFLDSCEQQPKQKRLSIFKRKRNK